MTVHLLSVYIAMQMLSMGAGGRYGVQHRQPVGRAHGRAAYSPPRQYGSPGRRYDGGYGHAQRHKTVREGYQRDTQTAVAVPESGEGLPGCTIHSSHGLYLPMHPWTSYLLGVLL